MLIYLHAFHGMHKGSISKELCWYTVRKLTFLLSSNKGGIYRVVKIQIVTYK